LKRLLQIGCAFPSKSSRREEAKPHLDKVLALESGFTVENFAQVYPIKKAADRKRYMDRLRLAGVAVR